MTRLTGPPESVAGKWRIVESRVEGGDVKERTVTYRDTEGEAKARVGELNRTARDGFAYSVGPPARPAGRPHRLTV